MRRLVERHDRAPARVAELLDANQVLAVDQVAEARRRRRPASARPPSSATCASAEPADDQRAARPLPDLGDRAREVGHHLRRHLARVQRPRRGQRRGAQVVGEGPRARLGRRRVRGRVPVGARGRHRAVEVEVGQLVGRQPGAAGRRHLGRGRVEIVQRLAERDLLRVDDPGLEQVGRVRRGRRRDVDHLDGAQLVARRRRRERAPERVVLGRVGQVDVDRVDERQRARRGARGARRRRAPPRRRNDERETGTPAEHRGNSDPRVRRPSIERRQRQTVVLTLNERLIIPNQKPRPRISVEQRCPAWLHARVVVGDDHREQHRARGVGVEARRLAGGRRQLGGVGVRACRPPCRRGSASGAARSRTRR